MAFVVLTPIIGIVHAKPGNLLSWWIAHDTYTLWVFTHDGSRLLQRAFCPIGRAPSLLDQWCEEGALEPMCERDLILLRKIA